MRTRSRWFPNSLAVIPVVICAAACWPAGLRSQETPLFGEPRVVFEHSTRVLKAGLTSDRLTLYYGDLPWDNAAAASIYVARRAKADEPFGAPTRMSSRINRGDYTLFPALSPDDTLLYFCVGLHWIDPQAPRVWVARRTAPDLPFEDEPIPVDLGGNAYPGSVSHDGREFFFISTRSGSTDGTMDLWVARFNVPGEPESGFHDFQNLSVLNSAVHDLSPAISPDGRILLWSERPPQFYQGRPPRPGGHGNADLWMATRSSPDDPFGLSVNLPAPPNSSGQDICPSLTADGRTLLYSTGDRRVWQVDACLGRDMAAGFSVSEHPTAEADVLFQATGAAIGSGAWDFGDGEGAAGAAVSHRYRTAGRYRVTLVVTSDDGACSHRSELITVACPAGGVPGWASTDVGEPAFAGSAWLAGDDGCCLGVCAGGTGLFESIDQFHLVWREITGSAALTARISEIVPEGPPADVGLMLRESLDPGARFAALVVSGTVSKRFRFRYREVAGERSRSSKLGPVAEIPDAWIQIRREGTEIIGLSSADGVEWAEAGRVTIDLPGAALAGVAVSGRDRSPEQPFQAVTATIRSLTVELPQFRRGDTNGDGTVDISDAQATLSALFFGQGEIPCQDAGDANDDGGLDISDAISTLGFLFLGQGEIPLPGADTCGVDPTVDGLDCKVSRACK